SCRPPTRQARWPPSATASLSGSWPITTMSGGSAVLSMDWSGSTSRARQGSRDCSCNSPMSSRTRSSEVEGAAYEASVNGADSFWRDLKYLTLYGFYTSEIGIEQELGTDFFPGRFEGAAPIGDSSQ